jgi:hypothetical protein
VRKIRFLVISLFILFSTLSYAEETNLAFKLPIHPVIVSEEIPNIIQYYGRLEPLYESDIFSIYSWVAEDLKNPDNRSVAILTKEEHQGTVDYHIIYITVREGDKLRRFEDKPYFLGQDASGFLTPAENNPNLEAIAKMKSIKKVEL